MFTLIYFNRSQHAFGFPWTFNIIDVQGGGRGRGVLGRAHEPGPVRLYSIWLFLPFGLIFKWAVIKNSAGNLGFSFFWEGRFRVNTFFKNLIILIY